MAPRDLTDPGLPQARERVIEALKSHFALDHLGLEEFERRLAAAQDSASSMDLARLVEDLPDLSAGQDPQTTPAAGQQGQLVAILGGSSRKGRWYPPRNLRILTILGGVELDFRDAVLPAEGTVIEAFCLLGGVEVTVPPEVSVQVEGTGILGGFEDSSRGSEPGRQPRLLIKGLAVLGGVEVRTRQRRLPGERPWKRWRLPL